MSAYASVPVGRPLPKYATISTFEEIRFSGLPMIDFSASLERTPDGSIFKESDTFLEDCGAGPRKLRINARESDTLWKAILDACEDGRVHNDYGDPRTWTLQMGATKTEMEHARGRQFYTSGKSSFDEVVRPLFKGLSSRSL
eukprot:CAMPEP_0198213018 /NCGR_PEP_ID=MMETSP1445-20131203/28632_1 /TAXON_ID=36898 /ORGANISM="Pyramimonas sp., Strain CCMP2087" /LENGTH=141 /DNA_ID=CAMNT_0043887607 /DNA_START=246 /DNA_END=671 /DNA_ORIENTATION=+